MSGTIQEYKELLVNYLRDVEPSSNMEDDQLLRKWFWLGAIGGGIAFFLVVPWLFGYVGMLLPYMIMQLLWLPVRLLQGLSVICLVLAIVTTVRK
jgi:hypothetical protein